MPGSPRAPPRNNFIPLIQRGRGIRPDEAPATLQSVLVTRTWRGSRLGKVPNPSHGEMRREEDEEKGPRLHGCADCRNLHEPHRRRRRPRPRHRAELPGVRPQGSARTGLRLRRVFRPPRDRLRLLGLRRRRAAQADRSRPREHLALRPPAARPGRRRDQAEHQPRLDQARPGRQPRPRAGRHRRPVRQGRLRQPHALLQGPRRRPGHRGRPRLRLHHPVLLLHRQPRRCRRRRRRPGRLPLLRVHPARPGAGQGRHGRRLRR